MGFFCPKYCIFQFIEQIKTQNDKRKTQNEISVNLPKNASFRATGVYGGSREIYALPMILRVNWCVESCCGARCSLCRKRLHRSPTAATRSGRFICHWQRFLRSPSTPLCSAQDDAFSIDIQTSEKLFCVLHFALSVIYRANGSINWDLWFCFYH